VPFVQHILETLDTLCQAGGLSRRRWLFDLTPLLELTTAGASFRHLDRVLRSLPRDKWEAWTARESRQGRDVADDMAKLAGDHFARYTAEVIKVSNSVNPASTTS
jgi:hypothetical protein